MIINHTLVAKHRGKGKRTVVGIVLHDTAGSGTHNDTLYLASPGDGRKVSVDFTVERDGSVWQLNPDLHNSWCYHAGRATRFKGLSNQAVTKGTVGIEIVQRAKIQLSDPTYTTSQVKATAELCSYLCKEFKLTKSDITTHQQIITDGSRSDPRKFPFGEFWSFFNMVNDDLGEPLTHIVQAGDTLWSLSVKYQTTVESIKSLNGMESASNIIEVGQVLKVKK